MKHFVKRLVSPLLVKLFPIWWKELNELRFWKSKKKAEGQLSNEHYEYFYTEHFGLDRSFYNDKVLLDIGCGPRGSLEWASMASRRMGLDPLANEYLRLGADQHQMEYLDAPSEKMPLKDETCDAVFSFNSLDHVEDVEQTLKEIMRVIRPGGTFLLIVEVNHPPTDCEPHQLSPAKLLGSLSHSFDYERFYVFEPSPNGVYRSVANGKKLERPEETEQIGILSAKYVRKTSS